VQLALFLQGNELHSILTSVSHVDPVKPNNHTQ